MDLTNELKTLTELEDCGEYINLSVLSSPLMNAENMHRVSLFRQGKECGTTIPIVLYHGFKLRYIEAMGLEEEPEGVDAQVHQTLRQLLSDVQSMVKQSNKEDVLTSKTYQEIIFRYVVWGEPLIIESEEQLLINNKDERSHTVSGTRCPSCSLSSYLCRWILEKDDLNPKGSFLQVNSYVKKIAREAYAPLADYPEKNWKSKTSFSRRVQNALFIKAFKGSMSPELFEMPFLNPAFNKK